MSGDFWTQSQDWASIVVINLSKSLKITGLKTSITYADDTGATIVESREDANPLFQRRIDLSVPSAERSGQSYDYTIEVRITDLANQGPSAAITSTLKTQSNGTYYIYVYRGEYSDFGAPPPLDDVVVIPAATFNFYDTVPYYGPLAGDTLINNSINDMSILAAKLELIATAISDLAGNNIGSLTASVEKISQALERLITNQADQSAASLAEIKKIVEALGSLPDNSLALEAIATALDTLNTTNVTLVDAVITMGTTLSGIRDGQALALEEYKKMVAALTALRSDNASLIAVFNTMNGILADLNANGAAAAGLLVDINTTLGSLTTGIGGLTNALAALTSNINGIKAELSAIGVAVANQNSILDDIVAAITASKTDLTGVIAGLEDIKDELAGIKGEIAGVKTELVNLGINSAAQNVILGQIVTELTTTNTTLVEIKAAMDGIKITLDSINSSIVALNLTTTGTNNILTAISQTLIVQGTSLDGVIAVLEEIKDALITGLTCTCSGASCSCGGCLCGGGAEPPRVITYTITSNISETDFNAHDTDPAYNTAHWVIEFSEAVSSVEWLNNDYPSVGFTGSGTTWQTTTIPHGT
ncbi:MAG: hypothetical protein LBH26_04370 [Treponema sp.]|nr:hypothetical protein [Treponema sp.]